ncbi:uncharacterized protein LOC123301127 [Chrysoperla carnea]|uniref:uncharacterized protein LOC123301127 n=1 Tax=Chrysoperla carnea TaxID=189513 RepID=UPI001D06E89F|nr:uncharacterized protein LOC123301127 [Chrysoperla carnea]
MVCRLSSCCCCSLRTGTLILGYFGLISGIITFFDTIINLGYIFVNGGLEFSNEIPDGDHSAFATLATCVEIYYIIILVICIQGVLFNYLLLIGIYKVNYKMFFMFGDRN